MREELILSLAVEDLVVLVFPLFARVLAPNIGMRASKLVLAHGDQIHVPNSNQEVFKFGISLERLVHELMVLHEFGTGNRLVSAELVVSVMERGEHLEEAEAGLLRVLGSSNDIRVSCGVEAVLNFIKLERSIAIGIELVESFTDQALAERAKFTTESGQKFVETNLTVTTGIKDVEQTFSVTSAHAWHSETVKYGLELTKTELA